MAAGTRIYEWMFQRNNGKKIRPGDYYVRFRCTARNKNEQVNDVCLPFKVVE
ncbi:hypothetical protein [Paraflavitalea speifideaquila]|uniref:hypothetical protein n=1 Tax=Paraflavitalea speifideaquila TaxID=3076558 RepID=UPI0028E20851|nr:hypothetical protein [Paraflavitalea speifideiaquila]